MKGYIVSSFLYFSFTWCKRPDAVTPQFTPNVWYRPQFLFMLFLFSFTILRNSCYLLFTWLDLVSLVTRGGFMQHESFLIRRPSSFMSMSTTAPDNLSSFHAANVKGATILKDIWWYLVLSHVLYNLKVHRGAQNPTLDLCHILWCQANREEIGIYFLTLY